MNRKFGIELEVADISRSKVICVFNAIGVAIKEEGYNHATRGYWKIVSDASVRNGFEVVSPVLYGEEGLESVRAVVTALNDAGASVNKTCGFHVHFDARDLSVTSVKAIIMRYAAHETEIDAFMPPSRRADTNKYCLSIQRVVNMTSLQEATTMSELA